MNLKSTYVPIFLGAIMCAFLSLQACSSTSSTKSGTTTANNSGEQSKLTENNVETDKEARLTMLEKKLAQYKDLPDVPKGTGSCAEEHFLKCMNIDEKMCSQVFKVSAFDCKTLTQQQFQGAFSLKNPQQYEYMQRCIANTLLDYTQNDGGYETTKMCLIAQP